MSEISLGQQFVTMGGPIDREMERYIERGCTGPLPAILCKRHDSSTWDAGSDEWVCDKCGRHRAVRRDDQGRALARQGNR